nr:tripartite tricarboxylate transporter substrate binding protein [Aquibacillus albus]
MLALVLAACGSASGTSSGDDGADSSTGSESSESNSEDTGSAEAASDYPEQQVKLVIPYSPGGATDIIFRLVGKYAEEELGATLVPVNMPGASSTTGSREVKNADPDGYTILGSHDVIATAYYSGVVDYSFEAFQPVSLLTQTPNIATVHADTGWENMDDFINYVKENPGEVKWGMTPGGTSHFFVADMLKSAGLSPDDVKLIGYEGTGAAIKAVVAGEIDGTMTNYTSGKGYFDEGTFVSIGVAHDERLAEMPDSPTMIEQGVEFTNATSRGVFVPKDTPEEVVTVLESAFEAALNDPELQAEVAKLGSITRYKDHEEYETFVTELHDRLGELAENMELQ